MSLVLVTTRLAVTYLFIAQGASTINTVRDSKPGSNWFIAAGDWEVRSFDFRTAQICRRIDGAFVQIRRKRP